MRMTTGQGLANRRPQWGQVLALWAINRPHVSQATCMGLVRITLTRGVASMSPAPNYMNHDLF